LAFATRCDGKAARKCRTTGVALAGSKIIWARASGVSGIDSPLHFSLRFSETKAANNFPGRILPAQIFAAREHKGHKQKEFISPRPLGIVLFYHGQDADSGSFTGQTAR